MPIWVLHTMRKRKCRRWVWIDKGVYDVTSAASGDLERNKPWSAPPKDRDTYELCDKECGADSDAAGLRQENPVAIESFGLPP